MGRNTDTSPAVGFSVPTKATTSSAAKLVSPAKPSPVAAISAHAPSSTWRGANRLPARPTASVSSALPSRVEVAIAPTWNEDRPIPSR